MATLKQPSVPPKNSSEEKPWEDEVLRQLYVERDKYAAELGFTSTESELTNIP